MTTIVATTTVETTLADFAGRSLGTAYAGGSSLRLALLISSLFVWHRSIGLVSIETVHTSKAEVFYRVTIMISQTLRTALGDWTADSAVLGYTGGAFVFSVLLALVVAAHYWARVARTAVFWTAFILTPPLGAVVSDFLYKPVASGGLAFSRHKASVVLPAFIALCLLLFKQRPASKAH